MSSEAWTSAVRGYKQSRVTSGGVPRLFVYSAGQSPVDNITVLSGLQVIYSSWLRASTPDLCRGCAECRGFEPYTITDIFINTVLSFDVSLRSLMLYLSPSLRPFYHEDLLSQRNVCSNTSVATRYKVYKTF